MKNFWAKFNTLPLWVKIGIGILILVIGLWIYDSLTGGIRDLKNAWFDHTQAKIEQQNKQLTDENTQLRLQNAELRTDAKNNVDAAIKLKAQEAIFSEKEKTLDAKQKDELAKVDTALKEQTQIEQQTAEDVDPYTRCVRAKEKFLALNLPSATKINCEDMK